MTTKKNSKQKATGDCFKRSYELLVWGEWNGQHIPVEAGVLGELKLCHGFVWDNVLGHHTHGWVEDDVLCYDFVDGRMVTLDKKTYYKLGHVKDKPHRLCRYTRKEAMTRVTATGLYYFSVLSHNKPPANRVTKIYREGRPTGKLYIDSNGTEWVIERASLPKKRGDYVYWTGESAGKSFREATQREVKKAIDDYANSKQ